VQKDHREICKYDSCADEMYNKLFHRINGMLDESPQPLRDESGRTRLHKAASERDGTRLRRLLSAGADINVCDYSRRTPLHHAAAAGRDDNIWILLSEETNTGRQDDSGRTALHCAAESGQVGVVWELLRHKMGANTKTRSGKTALDYARTNQLDVAVWLLEHRQDIIIAEDGDVQKMFFAAAAKGQEAVVEMLLGREASIDGSVSENRQTALHVAAANGHLSVVQSLIDKGADVKVVDSLQQNSSRPSFSV
jgi:ankyrin repeat protein